MISRRWLLVATAGLLLVLAGSAEAATTLASSSPGAIPPPPHGSYRCPDDSGFSPDYHAGQYVGNEAAGAFVGMNPYVGSWYVGTCVKDQTPVLSGSTTTTTDFQVVSGAGVVTRINDSPFVGVVVLNGCPVQVMIGTQWTCY